MKLSCLPAVLALALPFSSTAATLTDGTLAAAGEAIYKSSGAVSAIVTLVTPEANDTYAFGVVAPGSNVRPNDRSLLRINSTSKLLTAHVALKMAADSKLQLDAPYGPQAPMTLRQLITHTSGIPRAPDLTIQRTPPHIPGRRRKCAPIGWQSKSPLRHQAMWRCIPT